MFTALTDGFALVALHSKAEISHDPLIGRTMSISPDNNTLILLLLHSTQPVLILEWGRIDRIFA